MNSISESLSNSPPIKDENYAKTASLLKVLSSQTPLSHLEEKALLSDINANDQVNSNANAAPGSAISRATYIPFINAFDHHNSDHVSSN